MAKRERVVVYPFDTDFCPILRHMECLNEYEVTGLVSPKGWGLDRRDAGFADKGRNTCLTVCSNFEDQLDCCDSVIFAESQRKLDFEKFIYPKIIKAISARKNIVSTLRLSKEQQNDIMHKCEDKGVSYKHYNNLSDTNCLELKSKHLFEINTPVLFILGIAERTHKFDIQLSLRENFLKTGYKVSQIGSRNYCEMLGFHSFPSFMYSNSVSEVEKILLFNSYIKKVEKEERPDIIIIGIPGGIMPFDKMFINNFGILAYEVSQAVTPDAAVFSTLYEDFLPYYFELMNNTVKYKLGFDIDCFNLSNVQFDWVQSKESEEMSYLNIDSGFIEEKKNNLRAENVQIYNILNADDESRMAEYLVDKLTCSEEAECV